MKEIYQNYKIAPSLLFSLFLSVFAFAGPTTSAVSVEGGTITTADDISFCYSDDIADIVSFEVTGDSGPNSLWVATDPSGNILGSNSTGTFDFTNAGPGDCVVYHITFKAFIFPPLTGMNVDALIGWFALSNGITVNRNDCGDMPDPVDPVDPVVECMADGGMLSGGPFEFCIDGEADFIGEDQIVLSGGSSSAAPSYTFTATGSGANEVPPNDSAGSADVSGTYDSATGMITISVDYSGLSSGLAAAHLHVGAAGSNGPVIVNFMPSTGATSGNISGSFAVPSENEQDLIDGNVYINLHTENIGSGELRDQLALTIDDGGLVSGWVITDSEGFILGLPPTFSVVDFDEVGIGACLVWYLSHDGTLTGAEVGANAADLGGCFDLSNPITVNRIDCTPPMPMCSVDGGELSGGPFGFCVGDGVPDMIGADQIVLTGGSGPNSAWVITDDQGKILGLPPTFSVVDFDDVFVGNCLVWYLSFDDSITGAEVGANASDLGGCFDLSNPISVMRMVCEPEMTTCDDVSGGNISGGPFGFCVGDGMSDRINEDQIVLTDAVGEFSAWVVTTSSGVILGILESFSDVNFDIAGEGSCLVWHLSFDGEITGAEVGANAADLGGCLSLSNSITVVRNDCSPPEEVCDVNGGQLFGGPFEFCVGDGISDMIGSDQIVLDGNTGPSNAWVVTDSVGIILGLPPSFSAVNFDIAGIGACLVWHLSFSGDIGGAEVGADAANLSGCFDLSNPITVTRKDCSPTGNPNDAPDTIGDAVGDECGVNSGTIQLCDGSGTNINICTSDGVDSSFEVCVEDNEAPDMFWVLLTPERTLIARQESNVFDLEGLPAGLCVICHVSAQGEIVGLEPGLSVDDVTGCIDFSNEVSVSKFVDDPAYCFGAGLSEEETTLSFQTIGNPVQDVLRLQVQSATQGENRVVIYDILGRTLFNNVLSVKEGENTIEIDATEFDSGLHFINMTNGKSSAMESFVKDNN